MHQYIVGHKWYIGDAPFVGGRWFRRICISLRDCCLRVWVTMRSLLRMHTKFLTDDRTESIAITAGETKDPAKNIPRVVKNVF